MRDDDKVRARYAEQSAVRRRARAVSAEDGSEQGRKSAQQQHAHSAKTTRGCCHALARHTNSRHDSCLRLRLLRRHADFSIADARYHA